jgi:hypothetical protein
MEKNESNGSTQPTNEIILELMGIDKKWVRDQDGSWIDQRFAPQKVEASESKNTIEVNEFDDSAGRKKRWQFWKR